MFVVGSSVLSALFFHRKAAFEPLRCILCAAVISANAVLQTLCGFGYIGAETASVCIAAAVPFLSALILKRDTWEKMLDS